VFNVGEMGHLGKENMLMKHSKAESKSSGFLIAIKKLCSGLLGRKRWSFPIHREGSSAIILTGKARFVDRYHGDSSDVPS
jgi:hypothetical protein